MEFFSQINFETILYLCVVSFAVLTVLAISDKVIVYANYNDFYWSTSIIVIPIVTFIGLLIAGPEDLQSNDNIFWYDANSKIITSVGILMTLLSTFNTLKYCLRNNGIFLGIVIFPF